MHGLNLLGLNHTTAPLEGRERLTVGVPQQSAVVAEFRRQFPDCEIVLLSTCNRVELYIAPSRDREPPDNEQLIHSLAGSRSVPADVFQSHLYHKTGKAVVEHLFSVASSLDSMVLGETQILGQVRQAYETARQLGAAGPVLHPL